jgi:hypothetical protein
MDAAAGIIDISLLVLFSQVFCLTLNHTHALCSPYHERCVLKDFLQIMFSKNKKLMKDNLDVNIISSKMKLTLSQKHLLKYCNAIAKYQSNS